MVSNTTVATNDTTTAAVGPPVVTPVPTGPDGLPILPVFGLPGLDFYYIHVSAVISLSISIVASAGVLIYMLRDGRGVWKRPIGERLVIYLALCDLGYSISHDIEHSYFLAALDHPPLDACVAMAYFMLTFYAASGFLVVFTAINALVMVVFSHKLALGSYDWILLSCTLGSSAILIMIAAVFGFLGPTGAWCEFDIRKPRGRIGGQLISICTLLVFAIDFICYMLVLYKIKQSVTSSGGSNKKYHRSARVMIIFVVTYFVQNWPAMIYYIWAYFEDPHLVLVVLLVVLVNMGGLFNGLAYTVIRRRYQATGNKQTGSTSTESTQNSQSTTG